jgi:hypothetical protein
MRLFELKLQLFDSLLQACCVSRCRIPGCLRRCQFFLQALLMGAG